MYKLLAVQVRLWHRKRCLSSVERRENDSEQIGSGQGKGLMPEVKAIVSVEKAVVARAISTV